MRLQATQARFLFTAALGTEQGLNNTGVQEAEQPTASTSVCTTCGVDLSKTPRGCEHAPSC